jgi:hypothetical protein
MHTTHVNPTLHWKSVQAPEHLSHPIPAYEIDSCPDGTQISGRISVLPEGATVETCGDGFNCRTLKVRYGSSFFYVFVRDLEEQLMSDPRAMIPRLPSLMTV